MPDADSDAQTTAGPAIGLGRLLELDDDPAPVMEALRGVIDPELGINLVDLGLVYDVAVSDGIAYVTLTVTTPACPIGGYLEDQARWAALRVPGILGAEIEVVHEPQWTPALMSDEARRTLWWTG